ncbi:MAG TPA: tRNA (adenosine(37)-N6)-threonylcarbamoyltransferase complex dimerization subunit type 1 TsaB [Firmicutes bacterium]|nr:tRNA (adenosine(37)-N6)-threonylcarbamoyltransferase complex dimerization subunit type 1 TsaB [Bacillota bacterium]
MRLLALDTSTSTGGAALWENGHIQDEILLEVAATHSERLLPAVASLMSAAGWEGSSLAAIAVAVGPGSFTGLRIGVTTAKALAYGWSLPLIGVSTLEAMAWQIAGRSGIVAPIINARRERVYAAAYDVSACPAALPKTLLAPINQRADRFFQSLIDLALASRQSDGAPAGQPIIIIGEDISLFKEQIDKVLRERWQPLPAPLHVLRPGSVASLGAKRFAQGEQHDLFSLTPHYVRKAEAEIKWERAHQPSP